MKTAKKSRKRSKRTKTAALFAANEALAAQLQAGEVETQKMVKALLANHQTVQAARSQVEVLMRDLEDSGVREKGLRRHLDAELDRTIRLGRALDDLNHALKQTRNIATALVAISAVDFSPSEYLVTLLGMLKKLEYDLVIHEPIARMLVEEGYKLAVEHAKYVPGPEDAKGVAIMTAADAERIADAFFEKFMKVAGDSSESDPTGSKT